MIAFIQEVENIAEQYGLHITGLDATDVTLRVRIEVMPSVFIHIYRNLKKNKLNMALVLGNNRIYGTDLKRQTAPPTELPEGVSYVVGDFGRRELIQELLEGQRENKG